MGKNTRRRLIKKKNLPAFREWLNAGVGLSALLLAVVSFWTTARISGLEDYLRSEIASRNSELDRQAQRSAEIEQIANERERQIARLDSTTNEILAATLSAQMQLNETQSNLSGVRSDVAIAEARLGTAERVRDRTIGELREQSAAFDLFQRRQSYEQASLNLTMSGAFQAVEVSGAAIFEQILELQEPSDRDEIRKYVRLIKSDFVQVCPNFQNRSITLPEKPIDPGSPLDRMFNSTFEPSEREDVLARDKAAIAEWSRQQDLYYELSVKYNKARIDATFQLIGEARDCMCLTLVTSRFGKERICPSS